MCFYEVTHFVLSRMHEEGLLSPLLADEKPDLERWHAAQGHRTSKDGGSECCSFSLSCFSWVLSGWSGVSVSEVHMHVCTYIG